MTPKLSAASRTIALVKEASPPAPPRPMHIRITPTKGGFEVRKECVAGRRYAAVIYTAEEIDELGARIREARGGDEGGQGGSRPPLHRGEKGRGGHE